MWQYPPRGILVAVDFGQASARALRVAEALAARHGATITALHAETLDVPPYFTHDQLKDVERHRAQARREAQHYLDRYARAVAASFGGSVAEKSVASLDDLKCDPAASLMVVATGRHHGAGWFGDIAERLVRSCALPMLFVPNSG
jgi:nucleotide-binding universal stress UspA family protein